MRRILEAIVDILVKILEILFITTMILSMLLICYAAIASFYHESQANYRFTNGEKSFYISEYHYEDDYIKAIDVYDNEITFPVDCTIITEYGRD